MSFQMSWPMVSDRIGRVRVGKRVSDTVDIRIPSRMGSSHKQREYTHISDIGACEARVTFNATSRLEFGFADYK